MLELSKISKIKKTQNLKISTYTLYSDVGRFVANIHSPAQISIKGVCEISTFRVNEGNVKLVFLLKKNDFLGPLPPKKKEMSDVYAVTRPGRGMGEGEASPSPPRRENFEISLPSNGVSLHLRLNSIAFCLHTIHYNNTLFSTQ